MNIPRIPITRAGIWIDHSKAVLIELLPDGTESARTFHSDVERRAKAWRGALVRGGSGQSGGAHHLRLAERRRNALRNFYRRVWNALAPDDEVVIFGPGLAPGELAKAVPPERAGRIRGVESLGHLTDAQLRARVREHYGQAAPRIAIGRGPVIAG